MSLICSVKVLLGSIKFTLEFHDGDSLFKDFSLAVLKLYCLFFYARNNLFLGAVFLGIFAAERDLESLFYHFNVNGVIKVETVADSLLDHLFIMMLNGVKIFSLQYLV